MIAGLLLLVGCMAVVWLYGWQRQRQEINAYRSEIKVLQQASGGLQQTLARRGRRLDVLFSAVNEAVMRVDRLGRVMAANQRAGELFEIDKRPELPQSMLLFYRDRDWQRAFAAALRGLPDAAKLPEIKVAGRVLMPRLAPLGRDQALLLCVDMTDMYKLEAQRRTFLANLMHDLKTPLTSLLGYARSLERFGDDVDFRQEAATVIADEAKHVNHLLDALLTLDQIELSPIDAEARCDMTTVIRQVCEMLKPQCRDKQLRLLFDADAGQVWLAVSADDADRVLSNVLVNAIKHSQQQGSIRIACERVGQHCRLIVQDEGTGIPEQDLARVTERFYRVDKARTRKDGGHGLGLAIVKELIEKNAGDLKLANRDPHGLCVEILLPLSEMCAEGG